MPEPLCNPQTSVPTAAPPDPSPSEFSSRTLLCPRRTCVCRLIRETIYPQLRDHPRVTAYPHVRGLSQPLSFLDHDHPEGGAADEERSKSNAWEAGYVVALARHLLLQGYKPGAWVS